MPNSTRSFRLIAVSAALAGLLAGPSAAAAASGPPVLFSHPPAELRLAAVHAPARTLRPRAGTGRPVELEERLRILREHGRSRRTQGPAASQTPSAAEPVRTPSPESLEARRDPVE